MKLFAIDPGNAQSAFVVVDENYTIYYKEKNENQAVLEWMQGFHPDKVVIEKIASYGMAVGREVFDTCIWIGRFMMRPFDMWSVASLAQPDELTLTLRLST